MINWCKITKIRMFIGEDIGHKSCLYKDFLHTPNTVRKKEVIVDLECMRKMSPGKIKISNVL